MRFADLAGRRVAVWGFGREGRAALAALARRRADQPVTLFCAEGDVGDAGRVHPRVAVVPMAPDAEALAAFDVVIKSPGISGYRPELLAARERGTRFTSGTALWFGEHPGARVVAVTGTKGKSTTSALVAHLLRARGRRVALAGNIGLPLLELDEVAADAVDAWVVELSSFQTREAGAVEVGVVTNVDEEHLDWHGTRARYVADKLALADASRTLVVSALQPALLDATAAHPRRKTFGTAPGWRVEHGTVVRGDAAVFDLARSPLPGAHNALNLCAALATLEAFGEDACAAAPAIAAFRPLPHRLQALGVRDGVEWIDDSIATTPQATLEALASVRGRAAVVLVGGHDRGLDWQPFAEAVRAAPPHAIVANGASGARIANVLRATGGDYALVVRATLAEAVASARDLVPAGGVIVLSPGAPSFDQFRDYAERGRAFASLAGVEAGASDAIAGLGIA